MSKNKETYAKKSKNCVLNLTLREYGIDETATYYSGKIDSNLIRDLVTYSPTDSSHLGRKFDQYPRLHNKSLNKFIDELIKQLDVKNGYFFNTFTEQELKGRTNIKNQLLNDKVFLAVKCDDSLRKSLYASIRNALAHGNIIQANNAFIIYSVSSSESNKTSEFDKPLTFLLKVYNLEKLSAYNDVLERYA